MVEILLCLHKLIHWEGRNKSILSYTTRNFIGFAMWERDLEVVREMGQTLATKQRRATHMVVVTHFSSGV